MADRIIAFLVAVAVMAHGAFAWAQSKEDLLSGTPLDQQAVIQKIQIPEVANAIASCGAGKLTAGSATITVAVTPAGEASLKSTQPKLPPDVAGCIGGVISAVPMPTSGTGGEVAFMFTFPATPTGTVKQPKAFDVRFTPEYQSAWRLKKAGLGLLIPGCIITGLGFLAFAIVVTSDDNSDSAFRGTLGMSLVGLAFLIPGAVLVGVANKRLKEAIAKYHTAKAPTPGLAYDPQRKDLHLTLAWRF